MCWCGKCGSTSLTTSLFNTVSDGKTWAEYEKEIQEHVDPGKKTPVPIWDLTTTTLKKIREETNVTSPWLQVTDVLTLRDASSKVSNKTRCSNNTEHTKSGVERSEAKRSGATRRSNKFAERRAKRYLLLVAERPAMCEVTIIIARRP